MRDIAIVVLIKESDRYLFGFDKPHYFQALGTMARFAMDPELSLDVSDLIVLKREMDRALEKMQ